MWLTSKRGTSEKITTITSHGIFLGKTSTKIVAKAVASATRWLARKRSWPQMGVVATETSGETKLAKGSNRPPVTKGSDVRLSYVRFFAEIFAKSLPGHVVNLSSGWR